MEVTRSIVLDTNLGQDSNDVTALALTLLYCCGEGAEWIGVTHCTSVSYGVGAIRAVLNWYGEQDMPVGTFETLGFNARYERYAKALSETVLPEERIGEGA